MDTLVFFLSFIPMLIPPTSSSCALCLEHTSPGPSRGWSFASLSSTSPFVLQSCPSSAQAVWQVPLLSSHPVWTPGSARSEGQASGSFLFSPSPPSASVMDAGMAQVSTMRVSARIVAESYQAGSAQAWSCWGPTVLTRGRQVWKQGRQGHR